MRFEKLNWKNMGRKLLIMLFVCGLTVTFLPENAEAVETIYRYNRVMKASDLPTADGWHDYIIAWEDDGDYWFHNKEFFEDGESNFDERSSWFEIKANTRLSEITPGAKDMDSFTSEKKYGHMQIMFVGYDTDNRNNGAPAPMYRIRFAKANGGEYYYLDRTDFEEDIGEAQPYTVQDKTYKGEQCFHIFLNLHDLVDRYLTRDDENLESSLYTSSTESEYPLRLYEVESVANYTYESEALDASGNLKVNEGWERYYRYTLIDDVDYFSGKYEDAPHSLHMKTMKSTSTWIPILLGWRSVDGDMDEGSNGDTIYFCDNTFQQAGDGDYSYWHTNLGLRFHFLADRELGLDRYTSRDAKQFVSKEKLGNFQILYYGTDYDNKNHNAKNNWIEDHHEEDGAGASGGWAQDEYAPRYYFRFWSRLEEKWLYFAKQSITDKSKSAYPWTVVVRDDMHKKDDDRYGYGSLEVFSNIPSAKDYALTRHDSNEISNSRWDCCDDIERQVLIYVREDLDYMAIVEDFTVGSGQILRIDEHVVLKDGVKLTVEKGGLLVIDNEMYFNGEIEVREGGTMIVNSGGAMLPYINPDGYDTSKIARLDINGGNVTIMDNARLFLDEGNSILNITKGGSLVNWGLTMVKDGIRLVDNAKLINQPGGILALGKYVPTDRGSLHSLTIEQILERSEDGSDVDVYPALLMEDNAQLINSGAITLSTYEIDNFGHSVNNEETVYVDIGNNRNPTNNFRGTMAWCEDNAVCVQKDGGIVTDTFIVPLNVSEHNPRCYKSLAVTLQGMPRADYDFYPALEEWHENSLYTSSSQEEANTKAFYQELLSIRDKLYADVFYSYVGKSS